MVCVVSLRHVSPTFKFTVRFTVASVNGIHRTFLSHFVFGVWGRISSPVVKIAYNYFKPRRKHKSVFFLRSCRTQHPEAIVFRSSFYIFLYSDNMWFLPF